MPESLTVIATALNERDHLDGFLEAVRPASRVVIVDEGSRDGTRERLEELAAMEREGFPALEVIDGAGSRLIHAAKNEAMDSVDDGWIIDLDLDERAPRAFWDALAGELPTTRHSAFRVEFRNYAFGRWLEHGGMCGRHLRVFRAGKVRYPEDRAHSTPDVDGTTGDIDATVLHFASPQIHDFWVKMNRYTSQDAPLVLEHGRGGLRNRPPLRRSRLAWSRAAAGVFWNRYVKHRGFQDGVPGFIQATLLSAYAFVEQAKIWELEAGLAAPDSAGSSTTVSPTEGGRA